MGTNIEWTDVTDNILTVVGGGWWCRMISEGCVNCYAAALNLNSFFGGNKLPYTGKAPAMELRTKLINSWEHQTKPKRHFVSSMTDVFGDWVTQAQAIEFLRGMWRAPKQTFQVLTKRPDIARLRIGQWLKFDGLSELPSNIWIGTSVENQKAADLRIPELVAIPAKIRFLSVEPMLEKIDLLYSAFNGADSLQSMHGISWVIFGGESGKNARPCNIDWITDGVRQCRDAGVSVFVKQLGARPCQDLSSVMPEADITDENADPASIAAWEHHRHNAPLHLKDGKGGDMSEWPNELRVRQFPE